MRPVTVRYESENNSFCKNPLEVALRHFRVAFAVDGKETLLKLAKERIIYRPFASDENKDQVYESLGLRQRVKHLVLGFSESFGYLTLILPFIVFYVERFFSKPVCWKGGEEYQVDSEEGGAYKEPYRRNPFDPNVKNDPFYKDASWVKG